MPVSQPFTAERFSSLKKVSELGRRGVLLRLAGHDTAIAGQISTRQLMQPPSELSRCALWQSGRRSRYGFCFVVEDIAGMVNGGL